MSSTITRARIASLVCLIGCGSLTPTLVEAQVRGVSSEHFFSVSEAALSETPSDEAFTEPQDETVFVSDEFVLNAANEGTANEDGRFRQDSQIRLVQARSRDDRSNADRNATRSRRSSRTPYMIGDSPGTAGGNGFSFQGLDIATINHPYFNGNRFNASEAGSFMPSDRFIFSYRHFSNASSTDILGDFDNVDIERFVVGMEKTALDGMVSAQIRVPLLLQLDSDLTFDDAANGGLTGDRSGELGNMSVNFKALLTERSKFALAAGLAVNIPTAEDARITQFYDAPVTINQAAGIDGNVDLVSLGDFDNDTVSLIPYLAWGATPTDRFFHQGFFQIDVPLNSSDATIDVIGDIIPDSNYSPEPINNFVEGNIKQQTLLRLNMGFGYWLQQGTRKGKPTGMAALFEVHYTTSLDNGRSLNAPMATLVDGSAILPDIPVSATAGGGSHFNTVNLSSGLALDLGGCVITNGVVVPVTDDRMFDFEYNLQVNKQF